MAGFRETVSVVVDVVTGNAKSEFAQLGAKVKDTEGAFAKAKVGASGLLSTITGSAALTAGAVGTMAVGVGKALESIVGDYLDASNAVDDFRIVSGLSAQDASKWVTAAKQLDIPLSDLQTSFAKLATTLGRNPDALDKWGIQAVHAKDGSIDLGETLLRVTDRMADLHDPTRQAELGMAAFGKAWQRVIPIVDNGSAAVRKMADATGHLFTQDELDRNEHMTQQLARIGAGFDAVKYQAANAVVSVVDYQTKAGSDTKWFGLHSQIQQAVDAWDWLTGKQDDSADSVRDYKGEVDGVGAYYHQMALAGAKAYDDQVAAAEAAAAKIEATSVKLQSEAMQIPIELSYDAWAEWTKFQQAVADAANRAPLTAPMFIIPLSGGGLSGVDQVALANAQAKAAADFLRRNGR